ncbi:MAG: BatA domain-containing protein, partial [Rhizobacter sp.]|nr:BatA domain-containing protein [Chlorobiales bacterium]
MQFTLPSMLFWSATLAVPVVIHLLSKGHSQRIRVGSLKLFAASETKTFRRIRLTEWPLLLLRVA